MFRVDPDSLVTHCKMECQDKTRGMRQRIHYSRFETRSQKAQKAVWAYNFLYPGRERSHKSENDKRELQKGS